MSKMKSFHFVTLILLVMGCNPPHKDLKRQEIIDLYPDLFRFNAKKRDSILSVSFTINDLPVQNPLYKLSRDYKLYIDYLYWNYSSISQDAARKAASYYPDTVKIQNYYTRFLQGDSTFNHHIFDLVKKHLEASNKMLVDYISPAPPALTEADLMTCAARFFYAYGIDSANDQIDWYICVGANPYHRDSSLRQFPAAEAFCFMTLLDPANRNNEFNNEFEQNIKSITRELKPLTGHYIKLMTARKKMTEAMAKSRPLRELLLKTYYNRKSTLPFTIIDE